MGKAVLRRIIWTNEIDTSSESIAAFRDSSGLVCDEDDDVINAMYRENSDWLDNEVTNLDITLDHPILVIADLGLWNGRRQGYRVIGTNMNDIFRVTCGDYVTFYADQYNVRCDDIHHDGTNHYMFRELRCSAEDAAPLLDAIYSGKEITSSLLNRYTRSLLPYVAAVYGWPIAGRKRAVAV